MQKKIRVLNFPSLDEVYSKESSINTLIRNYHRYSERYGIEYVRDGNEEHDLVAIHGGALRPIKHIPVPVVSHLHGMYWTGDHEYGKDTNWMHFINGVIRFWLRRSAVVTVPSDWVGQTLLRDMHLVPTVLPHGLDWKAFSSHGEPLRRHAIVFAKDRAHVDVCDPSFVPYFCDQFPAIQFISTFSPENRDNLTITGVLPQEKHLRYVQSALVYINTTKETFGLGALEALASGVPVLGFNEGGIRNLVEHGKNGYLASIGDYTDLAQGFNYCLEHRDILSRNAMKMAKKYNFNYVMRSLRSVYDMALEYEQPTVSVVIPVYNKSEAQVERAIRSVKGQTRPADELIVVDDASTLGVDYSRMLDLGNGDRYKRQQTNMGVAYARNTGYLISSGKYCVFLDGDDWLEPTFIERHLAVMEANPNAGVAYANFNIHFPNGEVQRANVPSPQADIDKQLEGVNQVPTCCMIRRKALAEAGGYRARYAPRGAGTEDANLWLRLGLLGWDALHASEECLFNYSAGTGTTFQDGYKPVPYHDMYHMRTPFASLTKPENGYCHPVHQMDYPVISVIIPVSSRHLQYVADALDSLEAQNMHAWEAIVVFDMGDTDDLEPIYQAFPYARFIKTGSVKGAGHARNLGAAVAKAPFLLYLDADDWLEPIALHMMLEKWNETNAAVYTDYYGMAYIDDVAGLDNSLSKRILERDEATNLTKIRYSAKPYVRSRALQQPTNPPYIWCNVTTLIPTVWHRELGGFDEELPTWEDFDYWLRMSWIGKPFVHLPVPLLNYRFHTGFRREEGLQNWDFLLEYLAEKKRIYGIE